MEEYLTVKVERNEAIEYEGEVFDGRPGKVEEVRYGMLMMVLCDREGRVYDVWITFGSV